MSRATAAAAIVALMGAAPAQIQAVGIGQEHPSTWTGLTVDGGEVTLHIEAMSAHTVEGIGCERDARGRITGQRFTHTAGEGSARAKVGPKGEIRVEVDGGEVRVRAREPEPAVGRAQDAQARRPDTGDTVQTYDTAQSGATRTALTQHQPPGDALSGTSGIAGAR